MKTQTYYNTLNEAEANICNTIDDLCVNCVGAVNTKDGFDSRAKRQDFYIMYAVEGKMPIWLDNIKTEISKGQFLVIEAGTKYRYVATENEHISYLWLHFSGKQAQKLLFDYNIECNHIYNIGIHSRLSESWKRLFYEFIINDEHFKEVSCGILKEILVNFSRYMKNQNRRVLKSIFYIHEHFTEELEVSYLARMEGLSKSHYRLLFKEATGISPKEYITQRRIEAACDILEHSEKSIEEVSLASGYSDVYYFGRIFKKKMGVSPGKYRNLK